MAEEIKITVREEKAGPDVLKEKLKDTEKLKQAETQTPSAPASAPASDSTRAYNQSMAAEAGRAMEGRPNADRQAALRARIKASYVQERGENPAVATDVEDPAGWLKFQADQRKQFVESQKKKTKDDRAANADSKREQREQEAIQKASDIREAQQRRRVNAVGRAGMNMAEHVVGGSPFGGMTSAIGAFGPAAMIAAGIGAAAAGIAAAFANQRDAVRMIGLEGETNKAVQNRSLQRAASFEGSASGSREAAESYEDQLVHLRAERKELEEKASFKWNKPSEWMGQITGASRNDLLKNEKAIDLAEAGKTKSTETGRAKFTEEAGKELQIAEKKLQYDMRGARELEREMMAYKEFNRLKKEGATDDEAKHGSEMKVQESTREENARFGRIVNARSGAGDIRRAASLAAGDFSGGGGRHLELAVDNLTHTVKAQHVENLNASAQGTHRLPSLGDR